MLVLALAWNRPEFAGRLAGYAVAGLILVLPALAAFGVWLGPAGLERWWAMMVSEPMRLITGRGFDAAMPRAPSAFSAGSAGEPHQRSLVRPWTPGCAVLRHCHGLGWAFIAAASLAMSLHRRLWPHWQRPWLSLFDRNGTQTWWFNGLAVVRDRADVGGARALSHRASPRRNQALIIHSAAAAWCQRMAGRAVAEDRPFARADRHGTGQRGWKCSPSAG